MGSSPSSLLGVQSRTLVRYASSTRFFSLRFASMRDVFVSSSAAYTLWIVAASNSAARTSRQTHIFGKPKRHESEPAKLVWV
eukprot:scaffold348462_cov62-Attheya_sp.AAC.5